MAKALGGEVTRNPVKEIGWGEIRVLDAPEARAWFGHAAPAFLSFHWHGETFSIPPGATRLLESAHCANQAFALGPHLGLQCHVEMTPEMIDAWCESGAGEIARNVSRSPAVQTRDEQHVDLDARLAALHCVADAVYDRWAGGANVLALVGGRGACAQGIELARELDFEGAGAGEELRALIDLCLRAVAHRRRDQPRGVALQRGVFGQSPLQRPQARFLRQGGRFHPSVERGPARRLGFEIAHQRLLRLSGAQRLAGGLALGEQCGGLVRKRIEGFPEARLGQLAGPGPRQRDDGERDECDCAGGRERGPARRQRRGAGSADRARERQPRTRPPARPPKCAALSMPGRVKPTASE